MQQIHADKWFPSTLDFLAVAGAGSVAIADTWDFLLKIVKAPKKISRLNFFSHGSSSLIALQGEILADGSNVMLAQNPDTGWTQVIGGKCILDPFAKTWGDKGQNSGSASMTVNGTTFNLDDVRSKFSPDATLWLYLCHSAADPLLFQEVANTFQVTAKGFSHELVYCAPANFPTSRRHTIAVVMTPNPANSCSSGSTNFKALELQFECQDRAAEEVTAERSGASNGHDLASQPLAFRAAIGQRCRRPLSRLRPPEPRRAYRQFPPRERRIAACPMGRTGGRARSAGLVGEEWKLMAPGAIRRAQTGRRPWFD